MNQPSAHFDFHDGTGRPPCFHIFDERDKAVLAINAALVARRPLLVRGEPGTGKTQLAHAAAFCLRRPLVCKIIDAQTASQDLLWEFDSIARLANAQVLGAAPPEERRTWKADLAELRFVKPGPLWWAFDWKTAAVQLDASFHRDGGAPWVAPGVPTDKGAVLLIDEIDKAESDVPNGLLDALGQFGFQVPFGGPRVACPEGCEPLVVITTNEERELPPAFVRRCLVLNLTLPKSREDLIKWLMKRGEVHFPKATVSIRRRAAEMLYEDRDRATAQGQPKPGQAEYLDLLRAVLGLEPDAKKQEKLLDDLRGFAYLKHPDDGLTG